jgi:hypothetical protein
VATVGLSSCDAFLEENPKDQITEEQAYQNSTLLYLNTVASLYTEVGANGGDPDDWAATHDIVDRCRRSGFELLGIGIQTRSVEKFFPQSIVINDVKDLKRELFEVTQQLLIQ